MKSRPTAPLRPSPEKPRTRLRMDELLGEHSLVALGREMGVVYTQLYAYRKAGANPTLLFLEKLAEGISKLTGKKVSVKDLLD